MKLLNHLRLWLVLRSLERKGLVAKGEDGKWYPTIEGLAVAGKIVMPTDFR